MMKPSATDCESPGSRVADILATTAGEVNALTKEVASISLLRLAASEIFELEGF